MITASLPLRALLTHLSVTCTHSKHLQSNVSNWVPENGLGLPPKSLLFVGKLMNHCINLYLGELLLPGFVTLLSTRRNVGAPKLPVSPHASSKCRGSNWLRRACGPGADGTDGTHSGAGGAGGAGALRTLSFAAS